MNFDQVNEGMKERNKDIEEGWKVLQFRFYYSNKLLQLWGMKAIMGELKPCNLIHPNGKGHDRQRPTWAAL